MTLVPKIQKKKNLQKKKKTTICPQAMTLVFGALPPVAIVLALPLLLPSVPNQKGVLADIYINVHDYYSFYIYKDLYNQYHQEDKKEKEEGRSKFEIFKAVLRSVPNSPNSTDL